jgi:serine-type D-Ala-D-Ala carboxypeptidase/endopeptidase (penicillin-binding protein 4)
VGSARPRHSRQVEPSVIGGDGNPLATQLTRRGWTALFVVVGLVGGLFTGTVLGLARGQLSAVRVENEPSASTPIASTGALATTPRSPTPPQSSATPSPEMPSPVLAAAAAGEPPDPAALKAKITSVRVKNANGTYSGSVIDVGTGKVLFGHSSRTPLIPASTMKVLTCAAALSILGPDHRFKTSVVSPKAGQIVLVGGGDPYLATKASAEDYAPRASIGDLARRTAAALSQRKITEVRLGYDDSLFAGPAWNPWWPDGYHDQVSRVSALWVNEGRGGSSVGPRSANPAKQAATEFAKALKKRGVSVSAIAAAKAPSSSAELAAVSSWPLQRIVEQILMMSDNDAAEVMLRQAAIGAGRRGTTANGVAVVREKLIELGAWHEGSNITDGSGLARETKVPAATLATLLRLAAGNKHSELRPLVTGLAVAGVEGSLQIRFSDDASLAGRGVVRAKTGTLRKVHSLAGVVRTADGSLLSFAFLINNPKNEYAANVWLDRVTTAISRCGCS